MRYWLTVLVCLATCHIGAATLKPSKTIAGVPVYNLDNDVGVSSSSTRTWNVILKHTEPATEGFRVHAMCDGHSGVRCDSQGHPAQGGLGFVSINATLQELEAYAAQHHDAMDFIEPDMMVSIPPDEVPHEEALEQERELSGKNAYYVICYKGPGNVEGFGPLTSYNEADLKFNSCIQSAVAVMITATTTFHDSRFHGSRGTEVMAAMRQWFDAKNGGGGPSPTPRRRRAGGPSPTPRRRRAGPVATPPPNSKLNWGLDRIDDASGYDGSFEPGGQDGKGVHVYVLDTGIRTTHAEFGGRAVPTLHSESGNPTVCSAGDTSCALDGNGHGTHCAGTVGGATMGVAKDVTLHAVKVLSDRGSGRMTGILAAMDWVRQNAIKPAVISMSLGGPGQNMAYKSAIDSLNQGGITVVVAAGNSNNDACRFSPAYVPVAITVGSTTVDDERSEFSNYGKCIDIWGPGTDIMSAWMGGDTAYKTISGTSMACPHVAGVAALHLQKNNNLSPAQVAEVLASESTKDAIKDVNPRGTTGSPNNFLHFKPEATTTTPKPTAAPAPPEGTPRRRRSSQSRRRRRRRKSSRRRSKRRRRRRRSSE